MEDRRREKGPFESGGGKAPSVRAYLRDAKKEGDISKEQEQKRPSVKRQLQEIQKKRQASKEGSRMRQAERNSAAHNQPGRRKRTGARE
ncbi:hypothetical protein LC724_16430 [Blautia sp. RD014234]|nr:hypothetical protein [Blautia parvula]